MKVDFSGGTRAEFDDTRKEILAAFGGNDYLVKGHVNFKTAACKEKFKDGKPYDFHGNFFWVGEHSSGVRIRNSNVEDVIKLEFPEPKPVKFVMHIAYDENKFDLPPHDLGHLKLASPEED